MAYIKKINELLSQIERIRSELMDTFYYAEPEEMHRKNKAGWSATEQLEYANLKGYFLLDKVKQTVFKTDFKAHKTGFSMGFWGKIMERREVRYVEDFENIHPAFLPVSHRHDKVKMNEQKVFSDLLDLLKAWEEILQQGQEKNLRGARIKIGRFPFLVIINALAMIAISLKVIDEVLQKVKKEAGK